MTEKQQQSLFDRIYGLRRDLLSVSQELYFTGSLVYKAHFDHNETIEAYSVEELIEKCKRD